MLKPYLSLFRFVVIASCVIPFGMWAYNAARAYTGLQNPCSWTDLWIKLAVIAMICGAVARITWQLPKYWAADLQSLATRQDSFLKSLKGQTLGFAIFATAGLSLALELAMIRWQGAIFEIFALYKNFGLLACFLGLGLGYSLSGRGRIPLPLVIPLIAWQMIMLTMTKYGPEGWNVQLLRAMPVTEQLNMGVAIATKTYEYVAIYGFLAVMFIMTALIFIPIGQACGLLMDQRPRLEAYGLNLAGSLAGVLLFFGFSYLWTPPVIWFIVAFAGLIALQAFDRRVLVGATCAAGIAITSLVWPSSPFWEQIYSPYQLIERGHAENGMTSVRAAGHYFQQIASYKHLDPDVVVPRQVPHLIYGDANRVAVVGSGTGNDVAAALRSGVRHVDAIEIDPSIMEIGKRYNPDMPYTDPRVTPIVNDARSFLRNTPKKYDMIVYGLLDSHALLSSSSPVRLDSFVYTVEGLQEARERLNPGGMISLSFCVISPELGRKIYMMMEQAFDGQAPVCIQRENNEGIVFLAGKDGPVQVNPALLAQHRFNNVTEKFADPALQADVSTDNWPYFYMPKRVYPVSYLVVIGMILMLSVAVVVPFFVGRSESPEKTKESGGRGLKLNHAVFFLLGAGFMLIQTKGVTELGLTFGNTWQVIGYVIMGILVMACIANLVVARYNIERLAMPFALLLGSLGAGLYIAHLGGFPSTMSGRLGTLIVLTVPMFFSGICFSTMLKHSTDISGALAANLIGAMAGGLLEYNSMYFGFQWLYGLALAIYGSAAVMSLIGLRDSAAQAETAPEQIEESAAADQDDAPVEEETQTPAYRKAA